jgi:hypothetical protein
MVAVAIGYTWWCGGAAPFAFATAAAALIPTAAEVVGASVTAVP